MNITNEIASQSVELTCFQCGKIITKTGIQADNHDFCSHLCRVTSANLNKPPRHKLVCLNCGKRIGSGKKYCDQNCQSEYEHEDYIERWLKGEESGGTDLKTSKTVLRYLKERANYKCSQCGWGEINPFSGKVSVQVHHKDGNSRNHRPENLTVLCPNCHSLTNNYGGLNLGNGRTHRRKIKKITLPT